MRLRTKLIEKLARGCIDARELRSLLKNEGWILMRTKGSHEIWCSGADTFVLATHSKELKPYQIKQAQISILSKALAHEKKDT